MREVVLDTETTGLDVHSGHKIIEIGALEIINLVPDLFEAWHAGVSSWKHFKSLNKNSIGIEITNPGHQHGYKRFSKKQIFSLQKLIKILVKKYRIKKKYILGHSDVAPGRKKDPGEKFPWEILALSLIHISEPTRPERSRMPSSA